MSGGRPAPLPPGAPLACGCEPYSIALAVEDTLGCPLEWQWIPAECMWVHPPQATEATP